jgi:hypothetical protein
VSKRRHKPLSVKVTRDGVLTIEIGVETLAQAALGAPFAWDESGGRPDERYRITDAKGFALDVKRELLDEAEDGSSPLTNFIDKACEHAVDDGSEFWTDKDRP